MLSSTDYRRELLRNILTRLSSGVCHVTFTIIALNVIPLIIVLQLILDIQRYQQMLCSAIIQTIFTSSTLAVVFGSRNVEAADTYVRFVISYKCSYVW